MKIEAKVTSGGRVTLPREIRRRLGVRPGDRFSFKEDRDGFRITGGAPRESFCEVSRNWHAGNWKGKEGHTEVATRTAG